MLSKRSSGILLHPTSLPGRYGIGDFGLEAYQFVDFLAESKQGLWQILPIGPCGLGNSPYMTYCSMAGNPLLISPDMLVEDGFLSQNYLKKLPDFSSKTVDFTQVTKWKFPLLRRAYECFSKEATRADQIAFNGFCNGNASWLNDFAFFSALMDTFQGKVWTKWPQGLRQRKTQALEKYQQELKDDVAFHKFTQFIFFRQWFRLKRYANDQGIRIIGDLPIYVAHSSVDVWANQNVFQLDTETGDPLCVAGVPPDYFSKTGQLWGNPLYDWKQLEETGFNWWTKRMYYMFANFDLVRLDHFRGLEAYWSVPAKEKTAENGQWVKAPGFALLNRLKQEFGQLSLIAEDLGVISPEVIALRETFELPGMKILQFAFGSGPENPFLPIYHTSNCVVYTGTHDNNSCIGWFDEDASKEEKDYALKYLGKNTSQGIGWDLIRLAMSSVADRAVFPLQDVLELGSDSRMNIPSVANGNWTWRFSSEGLTQNITERLKQLTITYGRYCRG